MSLLVALFLGIIQGLTEFLPVSSSGHLILFQNIFGVDTNVIVLDLILHLGTAVAVIVCFRKTLWNLIKKPFSKKMGYLVIATAITVIIGFIGNDFFENAFNGSLLIFGFLLTAIFLMLADWLCLKYKQTKQYTFKSAVVAGIFQGLAIFPGLSRSGSTITSGIVCSVKKEDAIEFSFLLSLPVIIGGAILKIIQNTSVITTEIGLLPIFIGFLSAFISGMLAIKFMLKYVSKKNFLPFIIYLLILSVFLILNQFVFKLF